MIQLLVRICEVVDLFLEKLFHFFLNIFLASDTIKQHYKP